MVTCGECGEQTPADQCQCVHCSCHGDRCPGRGCDDTAQYEEE
jgi:hypothetical protein